MALNETVFCCCSDFALNLLLLTFVTPVMTRELAHNDVGNSSDASINASEESVHEDSSSYGEDGTSMSVNGDVGISSADDSDVEGGLMRLRPQ